MTARGEIHLPLWVDYADDPKIIAAGEKAELLYIRASCLMKRTMSDGYVAANQLPRFGLPGVKARAQRLVDVGLWRRVDGGFEAPAFLRRNKSRAELEAHFEERASAGAYGNHVRWHRETPSSDCRWCIAEPIAVAIPLPIGDAIAKSSQVKSESESAILDADFEDWWTLWPKKVDKADARKKYLARRKQGIPASDLLAARTNYLAQLSESKYSKHGATFLAPDCWRQWLTVAPTANASNGNGRTDWEALYERSERGE